MFKSPPDGAYRHGEPELVGEIATIEIAGTERQRRVLNERVVDGPDMRDVWSDRGTFSGDAEAFMAAKRAAVASGNPPAPE